MERYGPAPVRLNKEDYSESATAPNTRRGQHCFSYWRIDVPCVLVSKAEVKPSDGPERNSGCIRTASQTLPGTRQACPYLATASIAFLLNFLIGQRADRQVTLYGVRLSRVAPWSILFLCASVFFIICFMSLSNYFYESYSHFRYVKDDLKRPGEGEYKRWKYSTVLTCGYLGLGCFFVAYAILASSLFLE